MSVTWTVTRQSQWINNGLLIVEVSADGIDYCNPDALCKKYPGEFEEFQGLVPAMEAAIEIAEKWKADDLLYANLKGTKPNKIHIGWGATGGATMPFDALTACKTNYKILRREAKKHDAKLERCEMCGEILPEEDSRNPRYGSERTIMDGEYPFCSKYCAEKAQRSDEQEELRCALEELTRERAEELLTENDQDYDSDDSDEELRTQIKWLVEDGKIKLRELV